ncbi:MAG: F0F1 ATP synthase subunit B [Candidatus Adlerbacteria bacterium]|nr:F0F1 ATP synthase subunit B [Candidatus Adlerbacteria bacterium]
MSELFSAFGIDWRLLVINSVNFGLLLLALWYFLYGPLTKMMEARRQKIAQGVQDAADAEARLAEIQNSRGAILSDAGKEADTIVSAARHSGAAREKELIAAGEATAANMLKEAEAQAREAKVQALNESKQEVAKLIVLGMEKLAKK